MFSIVMKPLRYFDVALKIYVDKYSVCMFSILYLEFPIVSTEQRLK